MNRRFLCVNRLADVLKRPADVLKRPDDSAAWAVRRGRGADKDIDKRGGFWYSTKVPCANDTRWCGAMAAQLICNQWVAGSTPVTSSKKSYDIPLKSGVCRGAFAFWEKVRRTVQ